ncbi:MAG TPA: hypothetical protein VLK22_03680 [Candidatus Udaeobacter sp.]|nr:hypothetical protein [Candidatus Udaeobacter sp.]
MLSRSILVFVSVMVFSVSSFLFKFFHISNQNFISPYNVSTSSNTNSANNADKSASTSIKLVGTLACLPHKDLSGPQTMECAIGLKDNSGRYFFLDYSQAEKNSSFISTGMAVEVIGTLKPVSDSRYQNDGIIFVSKIVKIMPTENPAIKTITTGAGGIEGSVWLGPVCPVEKNPPDPTCANRPYRTSLAVTTVEGKLVKNFSSDMNGQFKVNVPPGKYAIRYADTAKKYPICGTSDVISVESNSFAEVNVFCDTGIR